MEQEKRFTKACHHRTKKLNGSNHGHPYFVLLYLTLQITLEDLSKE